MFLQPRALLVHSRSYRHSSPSIKRCQGLYTILYYTTATLRGLHTSTRTPYQTTFIFSCYAFATPMYVIKTLNDSNFPLLFILPLRLLFSLLTILALLIPFISNIISTFICYYVVLPYPIRGVLLHSRYPCILNVTVLYHFSLIKP